MSALAAVAPGTGSVRIRSTLAQWLWLLGAVTVAIVLTQGGLALVFRGTPEVAAQVFSSVATFVVTWAVLSGLMFRWQGVTLAPDGLHVHNLLARTIRWQDVASLSTDRLLGITYVLVRETSGRTTRLRAPTTGVLAWDRDFEAKYQTITRWHHALHGPADTT